MSENLSQTLKDVLLNQEGFELAIGYSLELTHGLMAYFPAIFAGTTRIVFVFDLELLEAVWGMLSPRRSTVNKTLFYVNHSKGVAFPVSVREPLEELLKRTPAPVLTRSEFDQITADGVIPFAWAPGLIGDDMSFAEFQEALQAALDKLPA